MQLIILLLEKISEITRTAFGYHILKINDRRKKKPKINVSHIMIFSNKNKKVEDPEERINELYAMIMQGEPFENIGKTIFRRQKYRNQRRSN